jgi:hypothetical protein
MTAALVSPLARLQSPAMLHNSERRGQARPASDLVPAPQSLTLCRAPQQSTNSYSIVNFTFN